MTPRPGPSALQREIKQKRPFRSAGEETFVSILKTADALHRRMCRLVEPHGITLQQYNVLRILRGAHPGGIATLEIRDRLIEQAPGITRLVDALDGSGLIRRERSTEDRRLVHCSITDAGLELLQSLDDVVDAADDATVEGIPGLRIQGLLETLAEIRARDGGS